MLLYMRWLLSFCPSAFNFIFSFVHSFMGMRLYCCVELLATKCMPFPIFPIEYATNWWISLDFSQNWFCHACVCVCGRERGRAVSVSHWQELREKMWRVLTFYSYFLFSLAKSPLSLSHSTSNFVVIVIINVHCVFTKLCLMSVFELYYQCISTVRAHSNTHSVHSRGG